MPPSSSTAGTEVTGADLADDAADPGGAGEVDAAYGRVRHHGLGHLAGVFGSHRDHVDDAVAEAGFEKDLSEQHVHGRRELGALQDDRVAGRERERDGAGRQDHGRVPRRHADRDTRRLAEPHAQAAGHVRGDDLSADVGRETRSLPQHARGELHVEVTPPRGGTGFGGHPHDEALCVALEQVGGLQQPGAPFTRSRRSPRLERCRCGVDRLDRVLGGGRLTRLVTGSPLTGLARSNVLSLVAASSSLPMSRLVSNMVGPSTGRMHSASNIGRRRGPAYPGSLAPSTTPRPGAAPVG